MALSNWGQILFTGRPWCGRLKRFAQPCQRFLGISFVKIPGSFSEDSSRSWKDSLENWKEKGSPRGRITKKRETDEWNGQWRKSRGKKVCPSRRKEENGGNGWKHSQRGRRDWTKWRAAIFSSRVCTVCGFWKPTHTCKCTHTHTCVYVCLCD